MYSVRWAMVGLVALSTLVMGTLSLVAWRRRQNPLSQALFLLTLLVTFYSFGYMCELASDTLAAIRFWLRVESVGIAFIPTVWIILAVRHSGTQGKYWPQVQTVLLMISTITFIISNTSEFHHLHYGALRLNPEAPFPSVSFVPGPWYWIHDIFTNLAVLGGNILYARAWWKASYDKRQQAFALLLGSLFPWIVFIAYILKIIPWGIDPAPIAFLVPGLLYAWAIFGLNMLEILPIARQAVFQKLSDGVLVFDRQGILADFNAAGGRVWPELTEEAKGQDGVALFREYPVLLAMFAGPTDERKMMWLAGAGGKVNYQLQRIELYDREDKAVGFMVILRDITNFSTLVEGLQLQATTDPLTKAWNRNRWQTEGEELLSRARRDKCYISLILVDLDNYKLVNDQYGHLTGDAVLFEFSRICRTKLRKQDIFGRYGGDEFVIILSDMDAAGVWGLANRLKEAVEMMTVAAAGQAVKVTASFGVITEPGETVASLTELLAKADKALYGAKKSGGNRVCRC